MAQPIDQISSPCAALEEDLVLMHYGDLSGTELSALQAHVPSCSGCSAYLAELGKLLPSTVITDEPPQSFWTDYNRELRLNSTEPAIRSPGAGEFATSCKFAGCRSSPPLRSSHWP